MRHPQYLPDTRKARLQTAPTVGMRLPDTRKAWL